MTTVEHSEYVPRQQLLRAAESSDIKQSPNTSKASGKRAQQQRQKQQHAQDQPAPKPVPSSMVTDYGMTEGIGLTLEVSKAQSPYYRSFVQLTKTTLSASRNPINYDQPLLLRS